MDRAIPVDGHWVSHRHPWAY